MIHPKSRRAIAVYAMLTGFMIVASVMAEAASPAQHSATTAEIDRWIGGLTSRQYQNRKQAETKLIGAGDAAIPELKAQLKAAVPVEQHARIVAVMAAIKRADFFRGPLVTVNINHAAAQEAFAQVCHSAGIRFQFWPNWVFTQPRAPNVTLHVKNAPLWQVLHTLAIKTGISPSSMPGFNFTNSGILTASSKVDVAGRFAFVINDFEYSQYAVPANGKPHISRNCDINFNVATLPSGIGGVNFSPQNVVVQKAVDNLGKSLALPPSVVGWTGPIFIPSQIQCVSECSAPVRWLNDGATVVRVFKGYVPVTFLTGGKVIVFHHLTKQPHQSITRGGMKFTFAGLRPLPGENWRVELSARLPGPPQSPWNQGLQMQIQSNIQLHGPKGHISKRGSNLPNEQFWMTGRVFHIAATYHGPRPTQIDIPLLTRQIKTRAYFTFHNIPIP